MRELKIHIAVHDDPKKPMGMYMDGILNFSALELAGLARYIQAMIDAKTVASMQINTAPSRMAGETTVVEIRDRLPKKKRVPKLEKPSE